MMVLNYITCIFTGNNVSVSEIPEVLHEVRKEEVNESRFDSLVKRLLDAQKNERILLITHHQPVVSLVFALNENFTNNKISVLYDNELNTEALEAELEKMAVHTADGTTYFPEAVEKLQGVYHADDRILMKRSAHYGETVLFDWHDEPWGVLMDEDYHSSHICGTVSSHLYEMSIKDKAKLMLELTAGNDDNTYELSDIIMLANNCGTIRFLNLPDAVRTKKLGMTELELFTGLSVGAGIGKITETLTESELPAVLIEDINAVIINMQIPSRKLPSREMIRNSMERICLK